MSALEIQIENMLSASLAVPVRVAVATAKLESSALTTAEQAKFGELAYTARAKSWLIGRAALKGLLNKIGRDPDTAELAFPNKQLSLSHSGELAIAVFSDSQFVSGVGVDVEFIRIVKPGTARFFLVEHEQTYIFALPDSERSIELLRLWTVKESLFKADINNNGRGLKNYTALDPKSLSGKASIRDDNSEFCYASIQLDSLVISGALNMVN